MPMVNVSEKTLDELKSVKEREKLKSLDGTIRWLFKKPSRRLEVESEDYWPLNSISDVNNARIALQSEGYFTDYYLIGPPRIIKSLDTQIVETDITFRMFILRNNLVNKILEYEHDEDCAVLLWYRVNFIDGLDVELERAAVKITNIECRWPKPSSELTNEELLERLERNYSTNILSEALRRLLQTIPSFKDS